MEKKNRICAYKGDPVVPGVNKKKNGINFAVEVSGDTEASLVLYRKGAGLRNRKQSFLLQRSIAPAGCVRCW